MLFALKSDKEKYTKLASDRTMSKKVLTYDEIQKEISLLKDDSGSVDRTAHAAWIQDLLIVTHRYSSYFSQDSSRYPIQSLASNF